MRISRYLAAGNFILLCAGLSAQSKLPEGNGRDLVERECTKCHGLEAITGARMTKERWGEVVDDMVSRGASGTDEEIDQIINYLASNFGKTDSGKTNSASGSAAAKVNVNQASAEGLSSSLAIPADLARAIVDYREKNGSFKNAEDLKKVPGIDPAQIDRWKDRLEF